MEEGNYYMVLNCQCCCFSSPGLNSSAVKLLSKFLPGMKYSWFVEFFFFLLAGSNSSLVLLLMIKTLNK